MNYNLIGAAFYKELDKESESFVQPGEILSLTQTAQNTGEFQLNEKGITIAQPGTYIVNYYITHQKLSLESRSPIELILNDIQMEETVNHSCDTMSNEEELVQTVTGSIAIEVMEADSRLAIRNRTEVPLKLFTPVVKDALGYSVQMAILKIK